MNVNISPAEYAAAEASEARSASRTLEGRVKRLENTVSDLLTALADKGIIDLVDPNFKETDG